MSGYWPVRWDAGEPECLVAVAGSHEVMAEFPSYGSAQAWIDETQETDERLGLEPLEYVVVPVRSSPGGRDIR